MKTEQRSTNDNPQPPVQTFVCNGAGQFACTTCHGPGDRIVGGQVFDGTVVGGRKSCAGCE